VVWGGRGVTRLKGVKVVDKSKQKAAIDLMFFNSQPTVASSDNDAYDVTDAEMAAKYAGILSVASGDYKDIANSSVANVVPAQPILIQAERNTASPYGKSLWVAIICRGTPTYTSTSDLVIELEFA
jgi:hypothetical protein